MISTSPAERFVDGAQCLDIVRLQTKDGATVLGEPFKLFISKINSGLDVILTKM